MKNKVFLFFMMLVCMVTTSFANDDVKKSDEIVIIGVGHIDSHFDEYGNHLYYFEDGGKRYYIDERTILLSPAGIEQDKKYHIIDSYGRPRRFNGGDQVTCFRLKSSPLSVYDFVQGYVNEEEIANIANLTPEEIAKVTPYERFWLISICFVLAGLLALGVPGDDC